MSRLPALEGWCQPQPFPVGKTAIEDLDAEVTVSAVEMFRPDPGSVPVIEVASTERDEAVPAEFVALEIDTAALCRNGALYCGVSSPRCSF